LYSAQGCNIIPVASVSYVLQGVKFKRKTDSYDVHSSANCASPTMIWINYWFLIKYWIKGI